MTFSDAIPKKASVYMAFLGILLAGNSIFGGDVAGVLRWIFCRFKNCWDGLAGNMAKFGARMAQISTTIVFP